jgi:hypothetical protein
VEVQAQGSSSIKLELLDGLPIEHLANKIDDNYRHSGQGDQEWAWRSIVPGLVIEVGNTQGFESIDELLPKAVFWLDKIEVHRVLILELRNPKNTSSEGKSPAFSVLRMRDDDFNGDWKPVPGDWKPLRTT